MKRKKAMAMGMVFIFIVAALTFALIMIFGYQSISNFMEKSETVEFFQFKSDLEGSVKKIYTEYGSVRIEKFSLPTRYKKICFVDLDYKFNQDFCKIDQVACDFWKDAQGYARADQNVFLQPLSEIPIKVYKIDVGPNGFLCLNLDGGKFKLRLEGKGDRTKISLPPK